MVVWVWDYGSLRVVGIGISIGSDNVVYQRSRCGMVLVGLKGQ